MRSPSIIGWAHAQRGLKPATRIVLWALAYYSDDEGLAYPSRATLARDTELSIDTIDRHLEALEMVGLISIEKRTRDGSGAPTSSLYRLNVDIELLEKHLRRNRKSLPSLPPSQPQSAARSDDQSQPQSAARVAAPVRLGVAAMVRLHEHLTLNTLPESSPQPPPGERCGLGSDGSEEPNPTETTAAGAEADERVRQFLSRYPTEPADRVAAERAFRKLSVPDQHAALQWIGNYLHDCRSKNRKIKSPQFYVRDRVFEGYASAGATSAPSGTGRREWVRKGTPEWHAWHRTRPVGYPTMYNTSLREEGWWFPSRWPPGSDSQAGAQQEDAA